MKNKYQYQYKSHADTESRGNVCDIIASAKEDCYRNRLSSCNIRDLYKPGNELLNVRSNVFIM